LDNMEADKNAAEAALGAGKQADKESKGGSMTRTIISFIALIAVLAAAYLAVRFLMGSNYNLDTLLTGQRATSLP